MATKRLQDIPIGPNRVALNRDDPRNGEGPFVSLVSTTDAEQVQLNGLTFSSGARKASGPQGNRASVAGRGGYNIVNQFALGQKADAGNRSGE